MGAAEFLYTPMMAVEIIIAELMFTIKLRKNPDFWIRLPGSVLVCLAATVWIEIIYALVTDKMFMYTAIDGIADSIFKFAYYLLIFLMSMLCMAFCFDGPMWMMLLYCSGGYVTQHMANNIVALIFEIPFFSQISGMNILGFAVRYAVFGLVYGVVWFLFLRNNKEIYGAENNIRRKGELSFAVVFICIGLSRITTDNMQRGALAAFAETLYAIVSCILLLNLLYDLSESDKMQHEVDILEELLHRDREQYKLTKENIEIINMKCHDLKHQIQALREGDETQQQHVKEIERAIMIYDSVANVKTGNDVLDVILTDKSLLCEKNHITLTCMVHGENLAFMDKMDIYSLFGNALSNAIEGVSKIREKERRCIAIHVTTKEKILSIHVENFYSEEPVFRDGLPVSQADRNVHGFGMKSMKYIAQKYNGVMSVLAKGGKFYLDFVIPIPE